MTHETTPGYHSDVAIRGNSFLRQYACKNADGTPYNLTGYVVRWRGVYGDTILEKTTPGTLSMTTPTNGTVNLVLTPAETRLIPANENMKYELELVAPDGTQRTVIYGDLVGQGGATSD